MKEIFRLDHGKYSIFIKVMKTISSDQNPCIINESTMTKLIGSSSVIMSDLNDLIGPNKNFSIVGLRNLLSISRNINNNFRQFIVYDDDDFYVFDFGKVIFKSYKNISIDNINIPNIKNIEARIGKPEIKPLGKSAKFLYSNNVFYAISFSDDVIYYVDENFKGFSEPEVELVSSDFMIISSDNVEDIVIVSDEDDNLWLKTSYNIDGILLEQFEHLSMRRKDDII
ncbi:MAG: hypothetical protein QXD03_03140 [Candidatus Anstonellales archaeon]